MRRVIFLILATFFLCMGATAKKKPVQAPKASNVSTQEGLFGVIKRDGNWYFDIAQEMLGRRFLVTVRFTSTPAGTGKFGGEQVNEQTVYWEKAPNGRLLLRSDLFVNVADTVDAISKAVTVSNSNPIIESFAVEKAKGGHYLVNVSPFFNGDNAAIGLPRYYKQAWGLQGYSSNESFIESIKTFPMNTEIRTTKTWTSTSGNSYSARGTGKVTIGLNVSFVLLPETPMRPRLYDPRIGYFSDSYTVYSDNQQQVEKQRFITRWRLEPKDSADAERMKRGELVEPKKPIVYYIDPGTPKKWRPYLIQGVNDWQKAFEKAGFKNAIMAKEWPENDSTMSMEDARYSMIRYLASPIENAYGPQVHDPRSGEIIESHICWYHNVMSLVHDWYMIQAASVDEAARAMRFDDDLMGQLIRFVSSHEVGHTLGLTHNFGSSSTVPVDSLRNKAWVEAHGHTPSIMDYARFNYVAQPEDSIGRTGIFPRIGDYDCWAIQWGYTPMWNAYDAASDHWEIEKLTAEAQKNRRLWYGDGETKTTNDSRCQTEDLGDDAVRASEYGILNLKREIKQLPEWTYESNDIYHSNISRMYNGMVGQFQRYMRHVYNNIGGVYKDYRSIDDGATLYTNVSGAKQREALDFIDRHIFTKPEWLVSEPYVKTITPDPEDFIGRVGGDIFNGMVQRYFLQRLTAEYPVDEYLADLTAKIFKETKTGKAVTSYRRKLQRLYVKALCTYQEQSDIDDDCEPFVLQELRTLQRMLKSAGSADAATKAHYASLLNAVNDVFERRR